MPSDPTRLASLTDSCCAVTGLQWGDEGKGKVVDLITPGFDGVVRYNGGANAGHSVVVGDQRYALHLVPSGILYPDTRAIVAGGVVVDPDVLIKELDALAGRGVDVSGLVISDRAHVVMPYHKAEDELREQFLAESERQGASDVGADPAAWSGAGDKGASIGTTKRGIGPCYADKAQRATAIRVADLLRPDTLRERLRTICRVKNATLGGLAAGVPGHAAPAFEVDELLEWARNAGERLRAHVTDTTYLLHDMVERGERLLFEGANAALLDVDHGTYPFVTSSSTTALGIPAGTGLPSRHVGEVLGVMKAYSTRVGNGPMPTELFDDTGSKIRERGREYGTTTGRPRRVGWLDLVAVRYTAKLSGATGLAVMLLDVLAGFDELMVCTRYRLPDGTETERFIPDSATLEGVTPVYERLEGFAEEVVDARARADLPPRARAYLELIEREVGAPVRVIGVGPERSQVIAEEPVGV